MKFDSNKKFAHDSISNASVPPNSDLHLSFIPLSLHCTVILVRVDSVLLNTKMESGLKYAITKEGIVKLLVIAFGCVTFALLADIGYHKVNDKTAWVFAAFVVSFAISVIIYILRITGVSSKISCGGCSFDGFDFLWSWFSSMWCLAAAITLAVDIPPGGSTRSSTYNKLIASTVFAFLTVVTYVNEAYMLRDKSPANFGYAVTRNGILKTIIVAFGAATFGLMVDSGYAWCRGNSCYSAITYALAAYIIGWGVTVLFWLGHMFGLISGSSHQGVLGKIELFWSVFCVILFWSASACVAAYIQCKDSNFKRFRFCQKRLTGDIAGFITGLLYIVDVIFLRR